MKLIAWNCRGLGNRPAVRSLLELQKTEGADILFLSETKLDKRRMERFRWSLGLSNIVVCKCGGKGGGIAVFWRRGVNVVLRNYSNNHIDVDIFQDDGFKWRFTGVYGFPQTEDRHKTWTLLRDLHAQENLPWLCAGDFNEILFQHEKEGGSLKSQSQMDRFREAIVDCDL